jgi:small nuclear ribonucleoprotein (snRNP)-like protein
MAIPMNTPVTVLLISGEQVEGEVAMADQNTYLCLRRENETLYLPWSAIKCVRGPVLPERTNLGARAPGHNPAIPPPAPPKSSS